MGQSSAWLRHGMQASRAKRESVAHPCQVQSNRVLIPRSRSQQKSIQSNCFAWQLNTTPCALAALFAIVTTTPRFYDSRPHVHNSPHLCGWSGDGSIYDPHTSLSLVILLFWASCDAVEHMLSVAFVRFKTQRHHRHKSPIGTFRLLPVHRSGRHLQTAGRHPSPCIREQARYRSRSRAR